jgi:hypothetical protein
MGETVLLDYFAALPLGQATFTYSDLKQANRYTYVGGDPVNAVDRLGLVTSCEKGAAAAHGVAVGFGFGFASLAGNLVGPEVSAPLFGGFVGSEGLAEGLELTSAVTGC